MYIMYILYSYYPQMLHLVLNMNILFWLSFLNTSDSNLSKNIYVLLLQTILKSNKIKSFVCEKCKTWCNLSVKIEPVNLSLNIHASKKICAASVELSPFLKNLKPRKKIDVFS